MALAFFSGIIFACLMSFSETLAFRILNAWFRPSRKHIPDKWAYVFSSRSVCESCMNPVKAFYLIPIFGFFLSKRKCPECQTKISTRFVFLETGAFLYGFAVSYLHPEPEFIIFALYYFSVLVVIASIDYTYLLIPTEAIFILFIAGLIEMFLFRNNVFLSSHHTNITLDLASAFIWYFLFHLMRIFSGYRLGLADVRLVLALGFAAGYPTSLFLPTVAAILAIIFYIFRRHSILITAPHEKKIPFGLFLGLAFLLLRLWS